MIKDAKKWCIKEWENREVNKKIDKVGIRVNINLKFKNLEINVNSDSNLESEFIIYIMDKLTQSIKF